MNCCIRFSSQLRREMSAMNFTLTGYSLKLDLRQTEQYKAIVRSDNNRLISIMPKTYKLITNEEVILPVMKFLDNLDNKWLIDPSHSFVDEKRMRLQITFPELTVNDGTSDVALSLFFHNSIQWS